MARDVLTIPVSTVDSEAAFSGGGRILEQYRNSLLLENVEVLVCTQDWLFGSEGNFSPFCRYLFIWITYVFYNKILLV
uniref:HAT C-terminal dimerisation domain-containing protein n=1 Tax=Nelumbo nucifera TaxID=4432 RepID=A0A822ZB60_NELNU|nr:TPA_asm: hypothetical protein HUJ06_015012 [Nelumbo nucifera]